MERFVFFGFYFLALLVLALFGLHKYYLLYLYSKYRDQHPPPPPEPEEWPEVTVQLPIYNEKYVIKRLLKAVAALDYPREKLHIQVLDDSTDSTVRLTARLVKRLRRAGYRIDHLRRKTRTGFKAGALDYGLRHSNAPFLAIFDADFVPHRQFLKQTIPYLMQPGIGMVQTRWGHINRDYSLLTRLQAIFLDAHFLIEHLARNRSGRFFNFNGTAGVWRRQAIEQAGGWEHDTLTEDLDLSYRAQLKGWKFLFLPQVVCPAELPVEMNAYKGQQFRWAKGSVQTALKLIPRIWRSKFPLRVRLEAIIHLSNNFAYLMLAIPAFLMIPILRYQIEARLTWTFVLYLFMFISATLSVMLYYATAIQAALGKKWPYILYLPCLMALGIGLSLNNGWAAISALLGDQGEFNRTPKFRIEKRQDSWRRKVYRSRGQGLHVLEFLLAAYFTYGMAYFLHRGYFVSIPFFLLFQSGFLYIAIQSLAGRFSLDLFKKSVSARKLLVQ